MVKNKLNVYDNFIKYAKQETNLAKENPLFTY